MLGLGGDAATTGAAAGVGVGAFFAGAAGDSIAGLGAGAASTGDIACKLVRCC